MKTASNFEILMDSIKHLKCPEWYEKFCAIYSNPLEIIFVVMKIIFIVLVVFLILLYLFEFIFKKQLKESETDYYSYFYSQNNIEDGKRK